MFGLIEEIKGVGKQKIWDLQLYRSLDGIERVFCQRNDKPEVYTWVDEEDVAYVINYAWILNNNYIYYHSFLHREVLNVPTGFNVDHINHICRDNTRSNLRICSASENHQNKFSLNYHYYADRESHFRISFYKKSGEVVYITHGMKSLGLSHVYFKSEKEVLVAASTLKLSSFNYDIRNDFSKHPEYIEAYYKGKYSFKEAQKRLMMHYADNIVYWFRFDLFDYYKSIGVEEPEWFEDSEGYLIDKSGNRFCKMLE